MAYYHELITPITSTTTTVVLSIYEPTLSTSKSLSNLDLNGLSISDNHGQSLSSSSPPPLTVVSHLNLNFSLKPKHITSLDLDWSHPLFDLNEAQPPSSIVKPNHHHRDGGSQPLILSLFKPKPNTSYLSNLSFSHYKI